MKEQAQTTPNQNKATLTTAKEYKLGRMNTLDVSWEILTSMSYEESKAAIKAAIKLFPPTFGLRAFPGDTFRISEQASYTSNGVVMLYTQKLDRVKGYSDFCKGTVQELQQQIVDAR